MGNWRALGNINPGSTVSRYGSGEQGSNGWSHYDNMSRYVGGRRQQRLLLRQRLVELLMPARRQPDGAK